MGRLHFTIFLSLSLTACDHRALSPGFEGVPIRSDSQAPFRQDARFSEEAAVTPMFCDGATSVKKQMEGALEEFPYAFYGVGVRFRCEGDPPGTPAEEHRLQLLLTGNPDECARLGPGPSILRAIRGVELSWIEISLAPQYVDWGKFNEPPGNGEPPYYVVDGELEFLKVPRLIEGATLSSWFGWDSSPVSSGEEVHGCAHLRISVHPRGEGINTDVGTVKGFFRARYCPYLFNFTGCSK